MVPIPPAKQLHFAYLQPLASDDRGLGSRGARRGLGRAIPTLPSLSVHVVAPHRIRTEALHRGARPAPPLPHRRWSCLGVRSTAKAPPPGCHVPVAAVARRRQTATVSGARPNGTTHGRRVPHDEQPGRWEPARAHLHRTGGHGRVKSERSRYELPAAECLPVDRRERRQPVRRCPTRARIPAHPSQSREG